jgi:hypothetical protein
LGVRQNYLFSEGGKMATEVITRGRPVEGDRRLAFFISAVLEQRHNHKTEPDLGWPTWESDFHHKDLLRIIKEGYMVAVIEASDPYKIILWSRRYAGSLEPHIEELKKILQGFETKQIVLIEIWDHV